MVQEFERMSLTIPNELLTQLHDLSREFRKSCGYKIPTTMLIRVITQSVLDLGLKIDLSSVIEKKKMTNSEGRADWARIEVLIKETLDAALRKQKK